MSGELEKTFDHKDLMDPTTNNLLGYAGVRCRVLGTFYCDAIDGNSGSEYALMFGSDLSNYYPNRGLKVFKARADVLARIINYRDPRIGSASKNKFLVKVGGALRLDEPSVSTDLVSFGQLNAYGSTRTKDCSVRHDTNR